MAPLRPLFRGIVVTSLVAASVLASSTGLVACTTTARVIDVYTALDGNGDRKRNVFFTDSKEIHCVAEMSIGRPGATIEMYLRQLQRYDPLTGQEVENVNRVLAYAENSPSRQDGKQKFDISLEKVVYTDGQEKPLNPDDIPYQYGRYQCEIFLDGELSGTALFNIIFPDCPPSQVRAGTVCEGFYENNRTCPQFGLSSSDPATCTCDMSGNGWRCP